MIIQRCVALFAVALALTACSGPRALLKLPKDELAGVRLKPDVKASKEARYLTLGRQSAREISGHGLLGLTIGSIAAGASSGDGQFVSALHDVCDEAQVLRTAVERSLMKHGLVKDSAAASSEMTLSLTEFGFLEEQPGYFVPYAYASASLKNSAGAKVWSATACSRGLAARSKRDYVEQADTYTKDFGGVAEDLARQLIEGPIRRTRR